MMTKRLLAAVLALAMVLALLPTTVLAEPEAVTESPKKGTHTAAAHSDDCGKTEGWAAWTSATTLPASGQYYLTCNVTLTNEVQVTGDLTLCLNGFVITTTAAKRLFSTKEGSNATFTITDCTAYTESGVYYAGALTGGKDASAGGGAVFVRRGTTMKIYDGRITGNTSSIAGGGVALQAGNTNYTGGKLYMYSGEISNNTAINGTSYKTGGALYMGAACVFEMTGGTLSGNKGSGGGAIYTTGNSIAITMTDATVTGNTASYTGAAIHCANGTLVTLRDTTITGNTCTNTSAGGTIRMDGAGGKVILAGETIVSGNTLAPKIGDIMLINTTTNKLTVDGLTSGSYVRFCTPKTTVSAAGDVIAATSAQTAWDSSWVSFVNTDGTEQAIDYDGTAFSFAAGHIHSGNEFSPWRETGSLPASGSYYLTTDVTVSQQITVTGTLNLCLNGHKITGYAGRAFNVTTGSLSLYNCGSEAIVSGFGNNAHGGFIQSAGTVQAENITFENNNAGSGYGGVLLSSAGTVSFQNCVFRNNTANQGAALSVASATTLTGCSFSGNTATASGGALRAVGSQPILVEDCSFTGNTAKAAAVIQTAASTLLTLKDVTITGNSNTIGFGAVNATGSIKPVVLQGKVIITGNTMNGQPQNLHLQNGTTDGYDLSGLTAGSSIGISLEDARISANRSHFSTANAANQESYFTSDNSAYRVVKTSDNKLALELIPVADHTHNLCGNTDCPDHTEISYFAWKQADSLPTEGNWYLTSDVAVSKQTTVSGTLNLCLNGYDITGYPGRAFNVTGALTLCSCADGSSISGFGNNAHGAVIQSSGTVYLENLNFTNNNAGSGYGGVLLSTAGTVSIKNCLFHQNTATQGGALSLGGNALVEDCTFTENTATATCGAIRTAGNGNVLVVGCTLTGNTAKTVSAIGAASVNVLLTLKDCTITGNRNTNGFGAVNMFANAKAVTLQGKMIVTDNTMNDQPQNLHVQNGSTDGYDVSGLTAGSSLGISLEDARITAQKMHFTAANAANIPGYFLSDDPAYQVVLNQDSQLILQIPLPPITHIHCSCGRTANPYCAHTDVEFIDWTHTDSLPTEGTWCLTTDVTLTRQTIITGQLTICLNGHNIQTASRVFHCSTGAQITITDCARTPGAITGATNSAILFATNSQNTSLTLWNGSFTDNHLVGGGAAVVVQGETVFTMYGGSFTGNWAESAMKENADGSPILDANGNPTCYSSNGGALFVGNGATFHFYGGTFSQNKATHVEYTKTGATAVTKSGGNGGAMAIYGTANLYGGKIFDNQGFLGGGVYVSGSQAVLNLLGTEISGNQAHSAGGVLVMSKATALMEAGSVAHNVATLSGGGMYVSIGSSFTMTGGQISDNAAVNSGAGIYQQQSSVTIKEGAITGNTAANLGGGFYLSAQSQLTLETGAVITGNEALSGGGVFVYKQATFQMNGGAIEKNNALSAGGGVSIFDESTATIQSGSITNNTAKNEGGGLYVFRATVDFGSCTISGNTGSHGGGVSVAGSKVTFRGTTITGNRAVGKITTSSTTGLPVKVEGSGGGIKIAQAGYKVSGVQYNDPGEVTVHSFYLANNSASSAAGGVLVQSKNSRFTMYSGTITGNNATAGGGGLYFSANTINKILGGTISGNSSLKAGGIFILNSTADISNAQLSGNQAGSIGGAAVIMGKNTLVNMKNVEILNNSSDATGGVAVIQNYATLNVEDSLIRGNQAKTTGGLYFSNPTYGNFKNVELAENTSQSAGGAIYVSKNCEVALENCTLQANRSESSGGATYSKGRIQLDNCKVLNNVSGKNGGALGSHQSAGAFLSDNAGIYANNTILSGNQAAEHGGAVYNHRGCPTYLTNCTLTDNSAKEGSAIYSDGRLGLTDITVTGNRAENAAVYVASSNYDGHSYSTGHKYLTGKIQIHDNQGGDLYLAENAIVAVTGETLSQGSYIGVQLQAGLLTQQLLGVYDYEGGDLIYTVTPGSRSITDPEGAVQAPQDATADETSTTPSQTAGTEKAGSNTLLYIAIGAVALIVVAAGVLVILKKKKAGKAKNM